MEAGTCQSDPETISFESKRLVSGRGVSSPKSRTLQGRINVSDPSVPGDQVRAEFLFTVWKV